MAAVAQRRGKQPPTRATPPSKRRLHPRAWTFAILGVILAVSALRATHLGFPLERDEGEFGYIAQELLRGAPMYETAYTQKLPGTYLLYALFLSVFGQSIQAIHLGLLLANAAIMAFLFLVLRRTHGGLAGCIAALVFGVMAMSPGMLGFAAHATIFVSLFATAGLYLLLLARERAGAAWFLASGLCFGLAVLMKQSGVFFAPLAMIVVLVDEWTAKPRQTARLVRNELALGIGSAAPLLLTMTFFAVTGRFSGFWFWTVDFARQFAEQVPLPQAWENLRGGTLDASTGFQILWILSIAGLIAILRDRSLGRDRLLYVAFALAGALSAVPGFYFLNHYYLSALPAVALFVGALGSGSRTAGGPIVAAVAWIVTGLGLFLGMARYDSYYFGLASDTATSRGVYGGNPFVESIEIGKYLKEHTTPEDQIAILGSETQILFYAQRRSASRFVNTYFLMAHHARNRDMQLEMIRDIERARPKYLVNVRSASSWMRREESPMDIFDWFATYRRGYQREGVIDFSLENGFVKWGADVQNVPTGPNHVIEILRRID
jgi:hypothetical protein